MDQTLIDIAAMLVTLYERDCLNDNGKQLLIEVRDEVQHQRAMEGQADRQTAPASKADEPQ